MLEGVLWSFLVGVILNYTPGGWAHSWTSENKFLTRFGAEGKLQAWDLLRSPLSSCDESKAVFFRVESLENGGPKSSSNIHVTVKSVGLRHIFLQNHKTTLIGAMASLFKNFSSCFAVVFVPFPKMLWAFQGLCPTKGITNWVKGSPQLDQEVGPQVREDPRPFPQRQIAWSYLNLHPLSSKDCPHPGLCLERALYHILKRLSLLGLWDPL